MLKKYYRREVGNEDNSSSNNMIISCISVIETEDEEVGEEKSQTENSMRKINLQFPVLLAKESVSDIRVNSDLDDEQTKEVQTLLEEYPDVFTDIPGTTDIVEHETVVTSEKPIRSKPYPVPFSLKKHIS